MSKAKKRASVSPSRRAMTPKQYVIRVSLVGIHPPVWRRVRVPDTVTLEQLHRVIQLAMGWLDYHLYSFRFGDRTFERPDSESEAESASEIGLSELKLSPGARAEYLYDFGDDWMHHLEFEEVLPMPAEGAYDWTPRVLAGERASPPEDVGGPPGYAHFLAALRDPTHAEHEHYSAWAPRGYDPERFDLRTVDSALALARGWGAI